MIEVVYKSCVHCRHHPHVGFLYSFSVLVFGINKYPVVCLVAGDVCVLLDGVAEYMVKVLEKSLRLSEQAMRRSLVHVETVVVEELHDPLHRHRVHVPELCHARDERAVVLRVEERRVGSLAREIFVVLGIRPHVIYLLDEAHGDELVAYHVPCLVQSCQVLVEARVLRVDILLDHLHLQVLLALRTVVGMGRSFFSEGCPGTASWDAGADGCFSDLFCDILASPLITRFCLASSSDLRSRRFLKDATSFRRASALRFASRSCCCKKEICCCSNAIISSFFILQRYEKKKTRLPKILLSILIKNSTDCQ